MAMVWALAASAALAFWAATAFVSALSVPLATLATLLLPATIPIPVLWLLMPAATVATRPLLAGALGLVPALFAAAPT